MSDDTTDTHVDNTEPSMEDILASIRRIIADEDVNAAANEGVAIETPDIPAESFAILEAAAEDSSDDVLEMVELAEDEAVLSHVVEDITPIDALENSDIDMMLSELSDSEDLDELEMGMLEAEDISVSEPEERQAPKLTGLGAIAAAGLGAVASAGVATAKSVTQSRKSPSPESMDESLLDDTSFESLDLMMDKEDLSFESSAQSEQDLELNEFLQIPDSDGAEAEDDIDALLGDMLMEDDTNVETDFVQDERVIDPAADMIDAEVDDISDELLAGLIGDDDDEAEMPASSQSENDLDLLKSLMADLTDDPYEEADLSATGEDSDESELVDDILALSMEDEIALQAKESESFDAIDEMLENSQLDDEAEASQSTLDPFVIDMNDDLSGGVAPTGETSSLSLADIAKSAEADADRLERSKGFSATGFAAGAGLMVATAGPIAAMVGGAEPASDEILVEDDTQANIQEAEDILAAIDPSRSDDAELSSEADLEEIDTIQETLSPQETADMPKAAVKKDAIINEVTEEATAGAFASLNQIVETNAVVEERGDRIGDLVQEALRPMLKEWLDKNLKGIVERAVTKEVKRISSGK